MGTREITKQAGGVEDLTLGVATEVQTRNKVDYTITQINASVFECVEATGADLADITATINTIAKFKRRMIWDTTADKPLWADGATAGDAWRDATGSVVRTPV